MTLNPVTVSQKPAERCALADAESNQQFQSMNSHQVRYSQVQAGFPSCITGHASINREWTQNQKTLSEH